MSYQQLPIGAEDDAFAAGQKGQYLLGVRRDNDTSPVADGHLMGLITDDEGRLKTSNKTASFSVVTGATNAVNATVVVDTRRASNVVFHLKNAGTVATGTASRYHFEASIDSTNGTDGTWFRIQAVRSNVNTIDLGTSVDPGTVAASTGALFSWEASVNAYQYMRVICAVAPAAGSNAIWTIQRGSYATEPIPAAQVSASQPVTLTSTTLSGTVNYVSPTTAVTGYKLVTAATTNAASIKASAGSLFDITFSNITATPAFVKFYNKASAPTVGTDVPIVTFQVAANATVTYEFGPVGKRFTTGIAMAVTGAAPATDTTDFVAGMQISATYL